MQSFPTLVCIYHWAHLGAFKTCWCWELKCFFQKQLKDLNVWRMFQQKCHKQSCSKWKKVSCTQLANQIARQTQPLQLWKGVGGTGSHSYPSSNKLRSIKQSLFTLGNPKSRLRVNLSSFSPESHRQFSVWSLTFHISNNLLASYFYWSLNLIINQLQIHFSSSFNLPQLLGEKEKKDGGLADAWRMWALLQ